MFELFNHLHRYTQKKTLALYLRYSLVLEYLFIMYKSSAQENNGVGLR